MRQIEPTHSPGALLDQALALDAKISDEATAIPPMSLLDDEFLSTSAMIQICNTPGVVDGEAGRAAYAEQARIAKQTRNQSKDATIKGRRNKLGRPKGVQSQKRNFQAVSSNSTTPNASTSVTP